MITLLLLHPLKQTPIQVWPFANESIIRVGRSTDNDVVLYSAVVSRRHVELRKVGDVWDIVNLGTNGTYVEGKRIEKITVQDGTVIRLARSGPNIQIRLGSDALKDLPEHLMGHRPSSSQNVQHTKITEMTDPLRRDDAEGEKTRSEGYHFGLILAQS